jgi:hypothetical protein
MLAYVLKVRLGPKRVLLEMPLVELSDHSEGRRVGVYVLSEISS